MFCGDQLSACGVTWDASDIARFLSYTYHDRSSGCLIWAGAKSRGRGNTAWYGSFKPSFSPNSVRAHRFYAVAVLGLRPNPSLHHLDHTCPNSLCVRHLECVPILVNLKLRWIRVQVGLDPDPERSVQCRVQKWLTGLGPNYFGSETLPLWHRWGLTERDFVPDPFDPRWWHLEEQPTW